MYNRSNNRGGRDVCKFFLEGRCRFGDSCKNEHPGGGGGGGGNGQSNGNRFAPLQNPSAGNARGRSGAVSGNGGQAAQPPSQYGITAENIRLDLTDNAQKGERPQWQFSAYAPGIGAPRQLIEGAMEQSEEEMRVMCYLANATGRLQDYDEHVRGMRNEMNQQIQRILNDAEGARRYIQDGEQQHPNRIDLVQKSNRDFPWESKLGSQPQSNNLFGQQKPAVSPFGGASNLGGASNFGQPSALGGGGAGTFGAPSNLGAKPAFGQSGFGQNPQPAATTFGAPSTLANPFGKPAPPASTFGGQSQPATTNPFAPKTSPNPFAPTAPAGGSGFGAPSGFGAAATKPPFGQTQQPATGFPTQQPATGFPTQSAPTGFPTQSTQPVSGFGQSGFGAASGQSAFGQQRANPTPPVTAVGSAFPATGMFQGQQVFKDPKTGHPMINVRKDGAVRATRVWFADGAPTTAAPDTEGPPSAYEGEKGVLLKQVYDHVRTNGVFAVGFMPECPPKREWVSFDL